MSTGLDSANDYLEGLVPKTWRESLISASYKGVSFYVKKSSTSIGRRTKVLYDYPDIYKNIVKGSSKPKMGEKGIDKTQLAKRDTLKYAEGTIQTNKFGGNVSLPETVQIYPLVYDVGLEVLEYQIEGYLIQDSKNNFNYLKQKVKLMQAFVGYGPGILMHPYLGQLDNAYVKNAAKFDEDIEEGGICRFTVTFLRGRGKTFFTPVGSNNLKDHKKLIDLAALEAWLVALDKFATNIKRIGAYAASMVNAISSTINRIANIITNIAGALSSVVTGLCTALHTLVNSINTLLDTPCALAAIFKTASDAVQGLAGLGDELQFGGVTGKCSGKVRGETVTLNGDSVPESMGNSIINETISALDVDETSLASNNYGAATAEQADNMTLITNTYKAALITSMLPLAIRIEFSSQEKMLETLNKITGVLDDYLLRLGEYSDTIDYSDMYTYFDGLKNTFISSMLDKNIGLVREVDYKVPSDVTSSLVLAYDMYYDLDRSWEARDRNRTIASHPGFLPSGETIKILEA